MRVLNLAKRSATPATLLAGILCLVGTSIQSVDFEDIYVTGGIVHWPEFGSTPSRFSFQFPTTTYERGSISDSSSQTTLKVGPGYSIDVSWTVEAVELPLWGWNMRRAFRACFDASTLSVQSSPTTVLKMSSRLISTSD